MSTAQELRTLAHQIIDLTKASPSYSVVAPIIENVTDHLYAVARVHELNEQAREVPIEARP
jgi:hypothetical protein